MLNHHGIIVDMDVLREFASLSDEEFASIYRCGKKRQVTFVDGIAVIGIEDIEDMSLELELLTEYGRALPMTILNAEINAG